MLSPSRIHNQQRSFRHQLGHSFGLLVQSRDAFWLKLEFKGLTDAEEIRNRRPLDVLLLYDRSGQRVASCHLWLVVKPVNLTDV
jgi:hypothetical protein